MGETGQDSLAPPSLLTAQEEQYVYNTEVLGLPAIRAATLAGMPLSRMRAPHIMQTREILRRDLAGGLRVSKEDVARGILDAIDRARLLAEPATEIAGYKEINVMYGHNAPQVSVGLNLHASLEVLQKQIKTVPTSELVKQLGAGNVIDADFYEVGK